MKPAAMRGPITEATTALSVIVFQYWGKELKRLAPSK
jgi:hypothetical protein